MRGARQRMLNAPWSSALAVAMADHPVSPGPEASTLTVAPEPPSNEPPKRALWPTYTPAGP